MTGKQFLYIVIATFITVVVWVVVEILTKTEVTIPPETQEMMEEINPNFDQDVINSL